MTFAALSTLLSSVTPLRGSSGDDAVSEPVPEGVKGLDLPLGRRVRLEGRGTTFVREVAGPSPDAPTVVLLHGCFASGGMTFGRGVMHLRPRMVLSAERRGGQEKSRSIEAAAASTFTAVSKTR